EDGIRDRNVTGVQTCALPIYLFIFLADHFIASELSNHVINSRVFNDKLNSKIKSTPLYFLQHGIIFMKPHDDPKISGFHKKSMRSEERRVGTEYSYDN